MLTNVKKELLVHAPQETCFRVFTEQMGTWWPKGYTISKSPMVDFILDPGPQGRWYSTHEDGTEVTIGHVITWNPYDLLVLNWQIDGQFQYNTSVHTDVEVRFIPEGPDTTRILFEHKNMERLAGGAKVIESMNEGWGIILNLYTSTISHYESLRTKTHP